MIRLSSAFSVPHSPFYRYTRNMRVIFYLFLLFCLCCQTTTVPFPGANLFIDPQSRYHMFFISPPWEKAPPEITRSDVPEDPEREDFVILGHKPLGGDLPDALPLAGLSIFPPRPLGSIESAMQGRRNELLNSNINFSEPTDEREFITNSGLVGREFSFTQSDIIFYREFFFLMPDGFVMRLFYVSERSLSTPELDFMTRTLTAGPPVSF
jgi:hypothetical protein